MKFLLYFLTLFTCFILDKNGKDAFFEESFLLDNVKPNIMLKMPFQTINNTDVNF